MGNGVVLELSRSKELGPLVWVVCTEDPEIGFNFLIGSFSLSISLGMIGSRKVNVVFEDSSEFFGKGRGKLWSAIRDKHIMKPEAFEYMVKKELGNTVCIHSF